MTKSEAAAFLRALSEQESPWISSQLREVAEMVEGNHHAN